MATETIVHLFDNYSDAEAAVQDLEAAGIPHSDISLVANRGPDYTHDDSAAESGAGAGASVGTVLGGGAGLLAGLGMLAIPGVGPVVAAGWLIATLSGAGVGAAAGGLLGALGGAGVSKDQAHVYAEGVRRGGSLVTVRADGSRSTMIDEVLRRHDPVNVTSRADAYQSEGWSEFDHTSEPYTASDLERERSRDYYGSSTGALGTGTGMGTGTSGTGTIAGAGMTVNPTTGPKTY